MNSATIVAVVVRHLLTALSGGLALRYGIDGATMDAVISGLTALAGVGWSVWEKMARSSDVAAPK